MAIRNKSTYADYHYEIQSETELTEAKWQIEQGDYKDLDDYIACYTRSEKRRLRRAELDKVKVAEAGNKRHIDTIKKSKAA